MMDALKAAAVEDDEHLRDGLELTRTVLGGSSGPVGSFLLCPSQRTSSKPAICMCHVKSIAKKLACPGLQFSLDKLLIQKRCNQKTKRKSKEAAAAKGSKSKRQKKSGPTRAKGAAKQTTAKQGKPR